MHKKTQNMHENKGEMISDDEKVKQGQVILNVRKTFICA